MTLNSIDHKLDKMSSYIIQSKESKEMVNKILSSMVNHVFKLYKKTSILDYYEKVAPELKSFWNEFLSIVDYKVKFDEKEKPFLRRYGEIPFYALGILSDTAENFGRQDLCSKLKPVIWAIKKVSFNHNNLESITGDYINRDSENSLTQT